METRLFQKLATAVDALHTCERTGNDWAAKWHERITDAVNDCLPSGSGFDNGTAIDINASHGEKLTFRTAFHHMNQHGFYDGWTSHNVIVRPSLIHGFTVHVTGRDRNDIKAYIAECFSSALASQFDWKE